MKKLVLAVAMCSAIQIGFVHAAPAADAGHGTVTFTGSIIESPCSITSESATQTVELGQISSAALASNGKSKPKNFTIDLEQCDTATSNSVTTTFTGAADAVDDTLLGITGTANGAGIAITDGSGTIIKLGTSSNAQIIGAGNNTLVFSAYLQGTGTSVTAGDFTSVANFTLAYP